MENFVIIDGNNLMYRAFYALPQLANFDGEISNAVFGFTNMLVKVIKDVNPKYIAVTFDIAKKNFRHEKFAEYKGTRKPTPEELKSQFPIVKEMLKKMHITVVEENGLEADDLMGCLSRMFDTHNIIVSADRDAFQLINDNTEIMFPKKGITETISVTKDNLKEIYGVEPWQVIDLKSLMGDSSDNIPGVAGVGEKTALGLLEKYSCLDGVYENIDKITGKLQEKLINDKEKAYLSQYLATIVTDKKLDYSLDDFTYDFPFDSATHEFFKRYQFNSLLRKDDLFIKGDNIEDEKVKDVECVIVDSDEKVSAMINDIETTQDIAIYIDNENFRIFSSKEYDVHFSQDLFSMGLDFSTVLSKLKYIFESEEIRKTVFDSKNLKHILYKYSVELHGVDFDCVLARYLINSIAKSSVTLTDVMVECGLSGENLGFNLKCIKSRYYAKLEKMDLLPLYFDIEMPLVDVLFAMEIAGFKVDKDELENLEEKYRLEIAGIENEIYEMLGKKINIASPKQLGEVLFDDLNINIPSNKKKSTSIEILNEIADRHPVVPLIIRWRTITKLYSTYIVGFQNILDGSDKIHTIFNQALTSTGRLSSSEPNLQNIPVRREEGKMLRKVFVPSHKDGMICSADYSQIELRLLANFSGDEKMIKSFNDGVDIHRLTASEIFGIPLEMVDENRRRDAKAINFGIVYGISDFGLSQNIGISRKDAHKFIELYFARYPKIEEYMKNNVKLAKENGQIKTLFGRIRPIPEIYNSNFNMRNFGERVAMNMPLQGSASDIIKLAMIRVYKELTSKGLKSKLIVQVHDELVVDVYPGELEDVKEILQRNMESVVDLQVKLLVNISSGKTWYDAK